MKVKFKYILLILVMLIIVGMLIFVKFFDNSNGNSNNSTNIQSNNNIIQNGLDEDQVMLPMCNDLMDNDGDGLKDYGKNGDPDCSSPFDNNEKNYDVYFLISFIAGVGLIIYVVVTLVGFKNPKVSKKSQDENFLLPPIIPQRAYDIVISEFLKEYVKSERRIILEKGNWFTDPYLRAIPYYDDDIIVHFKTPDQHPTTGEEFMLFFIEVKRGPDDMLGFSLLWCSLQRGEEWLKGGGYKREKGTTWWNFDKKVRTFRMSTAQNKQDAMMMYAIENSDDDIDINKLLGKRQQSVSDSGKDSEMTDEEAREMKRQEIWSRNKGKSKKKKNFQNSSQQASSNFPSEDELDDWGDVK